MKTFKNFDDFKIYCASKEAHRPKGDGAYCIGPHRVNGEMWECDLLSNRTDYIQFSHVSYDPAVGYVGHKVLKVIKEPHNSNKA